MRKTFGKRFICAVISILMIMMLLPTGVFADSYELVTEVTITSFASGTYLFDVIDDVRAALSGGGYMEIDVEADSSAGAWLQVGVSDSSWYWSSNASSVTWLNAGDSQTITITSSEFASVADFDDEWTSIYIQGGSTLDVTAIRVYEVVEGNEDDGDEEQDSSDLNVVASQTKTGALTILSGADFTDEDLYLYINYTLDDSDYSYYEPGALCNTDWISAITLSNYHDCSGTYVISLVDLAVAFEDAGYDATSGVVLNYWGTSYSTFTSVQLVDMGSDDEDGIYDVSIDTIRNGAVTSDVETAVEGDTVTLTVTPNDGYKLGAITVVDSNGNKVEVTENGDGTYEFTMPASDVTVSVAFVAEDIVSKVIARADPVEYNGHTYQVLYSEGLTWEDMEDYCEQLGGYLACITTAEEDAFLFNYVTESGCGDSTMFGFSDAAEEGTWVWVSGEETDYTNWGSSEPNGGTHENYAHYYTNYPNGEWNDTGTDTQSNCFLIEWSYVADGDTYTIPDITVVPVYSLTINVTSESEYYKFWLNDGTYTGWSSYSATMGGGETVSFGAIPETDCATYSVLINDEDGNEIEVESAGARTVSLFNFWWDENGDFQYGTVDITVYEYVFTMPQSNVTITLEYGDEVHTWDDGEVTTEATCTEAGVMTYTCSVCGDSYTEEIPAAGHTAAEAVVENEVAATCTTAGSYESVVYCSVCGEEISRETVTVEATGHTAAEAVVENEVAATCTTAGSYESVVYCSVCGEEISRETVTVEATGHTAAEAVVENEVAATCTTDGSYDSVVYCSVCGEEISRETVTVEATGHTAAEAVVENEVAATCTTAGSYESVVYCSVCGEEISRETVTVEATGHSYTSEVTTEATCTEAGVMTYTCSVCGDSYTEEIAATGHTAGTAVRENVVEATSTTEGSYDLVTYCTVCGEELSRETVIVPAKGTDMVSVWLRTPANYTEVNNAIAKANALNPDDYTNFSDVTDAINAVDWSYNALMQVYVTDMANAIETAIANLIPVSATIEDITIVEPIESTDTDEEPDEDTSEPATPVETNPTTGIALSIIPIAIAALAAVSSKRR